MHAKTLTMDNLISHRFRGFSKYENTLEGLNAALGFGVQNLEFDIRVAACGTPMIYHDEHAPDKFGNQLKLCDYKASQYEGLGGRFALMPSFDDLLALVRTHSNTTARLLIDVKDYGFEHEIHALVMSHMLEHRSVYVSWLPDVLYRMHELAPDIPLCLSHWCGPIGPAVRKHHGVYVSKDGHIAHGTQRYIHGVRSGWSVLEPIIGEMLNILQVSGGGICVPQAMLTREQSDYYHNHRLFVSTFSYTDWDAINAHKDSLNVGLYFIDNKTIFDNYLNSGS